MNLDKCFITVSVGCFPDQSHCSGTSSLKEGVCGFLSLVYFVAQFAVAGFFSQVLLF